MILDFERKFALRKSSAAAGPFAKFAIFLIFAVSLLCLGCSSLNPAASSVAKAASNTAPVKVAISPVSAVLSPGATQQFSVTLENTSDTGITWTTAGGTVSSSGVFTAPKPKSSTQIVLIATSNADPTKQASATITVTAARSTNLGITTTSLPEATQGVPFSASLGASGGSAPYQWKLSSGSLPSGLQLSSDGSINGITSQTGNFPFTSAVNDATGKSISQAFALTVTAAGTGSFDGPAELPRVYVQSSMADTPAPGSTTSVAAGADLQSMINAANCGDTLQLQAGATYTGAFTLPAKSCDDSHWIIIRTSAPDSALPAEGVRITPCYAGVSSLPGRPSFSCTSTKNVLAKLEYATTGSGPIVLANGANHYRLLGLEITRAAPGDAVYNLVLPDSNGANDHIVFDRVWMHGTAQDETTRAIATTGSTYFALVDSYLNDFHCTAIVGACGDSQAISGGLGSSPMGPIKIVDNFLEAASENIIMGGGPATVAPADIEIRGNHFFKPLIWMAGTPGFVGGKGGHPFVVKNFCEFKNAQRVLVEGNLMEYTWGGFSQTGFAILLTPKNQSVGTASVCPGCQVTDVTIRYNLIRHTGAGMQIGNGASDSGGLAMAGERYSIHDVIFDDMNGPAYDGPGLMAQVSTGAGAPILQSVSINHVTAFPAHSVFAFGDPILTQAPMNNFTFTNSIVDAGLYPMESIGGGTTDCAHHPAPSIVLPSCFANYTFSHNVIFTLPKNAPVSTWPSGNFFPASATDIDFVNYENGNGGDYHLLASSPYKNAGSDGKDLGADVDAILSATAGVE